MAAAARPVAVEVVGFGRAQAVRTARVPARVGGLVVELHPALERGRALAAGEAAVRLDPEDAENDEALAAARLDAARAEAARLEASAAPLEARVAIAARLLELERQETERLAALQAQGLVREREPDAARLALLRQEDGLEALRAQRDQLAAQRDAAAAAVREAAASLARARLALARTTVRAPFAGVVAAAPVQAQEHVAAGQVLFELHDLARVEVPAPVPLEEAALLAPALAGRPVPARVTVGDAAWEGTLARLEPVDPATQTVRAVVVVDNPSDGPPLPPGAFCRVALLAPPVEAGVVIPLEALQERDRVFVADDERLRIVEVRPGRRLGRWRVVEAGLAPGALVVVSPLERAIAGTALSVVVEEDGP
ncbi:MAG: efflux RND transporter periplasmic adaptor subunit [Planctomycetes bacterium]|nr:efflux RND transporter periplasmic adaptor subunit [Planctomycetota bacterium]